LAPGESPAPFFMDWPGYCSMTTVAARSVKEHFRLLTPEDDVSGYDGHRNLGDLSRLRQTPALQLAENED
jgi:hypothetical protein